MNRLLKEPLLHFLLIGGLIFFTYSRLVGNDYADSTDIVVSLRQQENLARTFERTWQRPPTQSELNGLIVDFLRQEIAYRESQKMQLDRDDIVIRRRLRQKLEMLAEDVALLAPPNEEALQEYLANNQERFRQPTVVTVQQIYFNADDDPESAGQAAINLLRLLQEDAASIDVDSAGDASMLPPQLENVRVTELDSLFGRGFSDGIAGIEAGSWGGPLRSGYGLHLVKVEARTEGYIPELADIEAAVRREWLTVRRNEAIDGLYDRLAENYEITIEAPPEIQPPSESP